MYLDPEQARSRLIAFGDYSAEAAPAVEALAYLLQMIEAAIDDWLGYHAAPTDYEHRLYSSSHGIIYPPILPVIAVSEVLIVPAQTTGPEATPVTTLVTSAVWDQGSAIRTSAPDSAFIVRYRAGYDPLPPTFGFATFQLLRQTLQASGLSGDLSFLNKEPRQASSISLPGGLSKSYAGSSGGGGGGAGGEAANTPLEKAMIPLRRYRRKFIL